MPRFAHRRQGGITNANHIPRQTERELSGWTLTNIFSLTAGQSDPLGNNNAASIIPNNGFLNHQISRTVATPSGTYCISGYFKAAGYNFLLIYNGAAFQSFNLGTGALGTVTGMPNPIMTDVGNGWYRCSGTFATTSTAITIAVCPTDAYAVYNGDQVSGILYFGLQVELGKFPTKYNPVP